MQSRTFSARGSGFCALASAAALFTAPVLRADVTYGLTAYWNFDSNLTDQAPAYLFSAGTVADDAVFVGGPNADFGTGLFGGGYAGNGATGYAEVPLSEDVSGLKTGSVSVSFWFRMQSPVSEWMAAVAVGEGSAWRIARVGSNNPLQMGFAGGSGDIFSTTVFGTPAAPAADWHHLAAVTEGGVATRLYIDGVLESTGAVPALTDNGSPALWIGGNPQAGGRSWNGSLDDVGIWNRALSAADVLQIYNQGKTGGKSLGVLLAEEGVDTDADGMPDTWEAANLPAGAAADNGSVNPAFGPAGDPDADGSPNLQEFARRTNPQLADTDTDGLKDGAETGTGTYVSAADTGTDPLKADTDGDGLKDGVENPSLPYNPLNAAAQPGTSPLLADTDGDTFPDGIEITYFSNPTSSDSIPSAGGLPVTDTFEDGIFDPARWSVNVGIPGGGASVREEGGHIALNGRGHFYTREEFDPVTQPGIVITGKWTFRSTDDFIQILTRSDALPAGDYGETNEGIEFYATQTDNSVSINTRNPSFTIDNLQRSGVIRLTQGRTYSFTVLDDGEGFLSLRLTEDGNPANIVRINGQLTSASGTRGHIVFHNREGARSGELQEVNIVSLADSDNDGMPDFWETLNGLDKTVANGGGDADGDGATNLDEYVKGLDPKDADTDNDGAPDGSETLTGAWVSATDRGTDPLIADADGDGLPDGAETNTGIYVGASDTGSNPFIVDSDGDGMNDGAEVAAGRNPSDPGDALSGIRGGLTAYWNFDGTLDDIAHSSGLGESSVADNGTFTGAPDAGFSASGHSGSGALALNGGSGWVTVPKSTDTIGNTVTGSVSVSIWLKADAFDSEWQAAIAHGEGSHWRIARQGNTAPGIMGYAGGSADIYSSTTFAAPTGWYHVAAVTAEGSGTSLYINGVLESTGPEPALDTALAAANDLFIGANPGAAGREWNGQIDDAAIWNRPLNSGEVSGIYQAGAAGGSLGTLIGLSSAPSISITEALYNPVTRQVSLTWTSAPGAAYTVSYSTDLTDWSGTITDSQPGTSGSTTYSFSLPVPLQNAGKVFFRVEQN